MRDLIAALYEGTVFGDLDEGVPYELDPDRKQASRDGGKVPGFILTGRTYPLKDILKQSGAEYHADKKAWTIYASAPNLLWSLAKRGVKITPLYIDDELAESEAWNRMAREQAARETARRKRLRDRAMAAAEPEPGLLHKGLKMVFGRWVKTR